MSSKSKQSGKKLMKLVNLSVTLNKCNALKNVVRQSKHLEKGFSDEILVATLMEKKCDTVKCR